MKTILIDPYPREMKLIFTKEKLNLLKKNFNLIYAPKSNKHKFYEQHINKAEFIIGQPDLSADLIKKASKLKAIFNVESNFMDNMDYDYCFKNNIYVLSTAPVFAQTVAEIALGFTISLKRGQSVTVERNIFHKFYSSKGSGMVMAGEVSQVNDDNNDNYFLEPIGRFSEIQEDEPPLHPLWNEI